MADNSVKNLSQDPERTDGGIYAGAEKYTKEAHPEYNIAYDPATGQQTGAGVPGSINELKQHTGTGGRVGLGQESVGGSGVIDEITRQAVIPAPAPTREHLLEAYPGMYPGLEKQIEQEKITKQRAETEEKEKKEEVPMLEHSVLFKTDQEGNIISDDIEIKHHHSETQHEPRGPVKQLFHTLHLDRHDRKIAKEQNEVEEKDIKNRLLELSRISNRPSEQVAGVIENYSQSHTDAEGERHMVNRHGERVLSKSRPVEEPKVFRNEAPAAGGAGDGKVGLSLAMLNPEGCARKEKEEQVLRTGGNYMELEQRSHDEVHIPSDQIDHLIHVEKQRRAQGLPAIDPFDTSQLKINFHTADAFDAADKR